MRHFGISRQAFYRWTRRFAAQGAAGLSDLPSTPHLLPKATSQEVVSKILYLRQTYHFGAGKIADYLKRFHQQSLAVSSVHRILDQARDESAAEQSKASATRRPLAAV